ncbi:sialidase family protein [Streptomyces sp. MK37H]|uniref:sialidase family protein n=1 Tax=Streptomyces sp. MK37H TaxID=2699117 RepID=UPI001B366AE7|nr:sialidase family protein [Streptomyces sp. MK37H]MBP8537050.1 hypothetical protein [Streptomyces sp. MK37H]
MSLRRTVLPAVLVVIPFLALMLGVFVLVSSQSTEDREKRYRQVLEDPTPSAQDVTEVAGAPSDVVSGEDGSTLLSYFAADVEDDEGFAASAWRLYGPDGDVLAEDAYHTDSWEAGGSSSTSFTAVPGGFLHLSDATYPEDDGDFFLDPRGKRHPVRSSHTALGFRTGDVVLSLPYGDPKMLFRPSQRTVAPAKGLPRTRDLDSYVVEDRGTVLGVQVPEDDGPSRGVRRRGDRQRSQELPYRATVRDGDLATRGDSAAVALQKSADGSDRRLVALFLTTDNGRRWTTLRNSAHVPLDVFTPGGDEVTVEILADGRVLLDQGGDTSLLADTSHDNTFHRVTKPAEFVRVLARGNTLYGIADAEDPSYDLVRGEGLWLSRDGGHTWSRFPDGDDD